MSLAQLDILTRAGAVCTILLMATLFLRQHRHLGVPAILFAPLAICVSGFVAGNTPTASLAPTGLLGFVAHSVSGFSVVFLWWFCLSCFDREFKLRGGVLCVGLAWAFLAALDRGLLSNALTGSGLSVPLVVLGFTIVIHLVWRLLAERQGDLIQDRYDARFVVAILLGGMLFVDLAADALFGFDWRPLAFSMAQNVMVLTFGVWLANKLLVVRPELFAFAAAESDQKLSEPLPQRSIQSDNEMHCRLTALLDGERIFLDPELTFATFAKRMGASERTVRKLINHELGYDHFRTFLNHYRVAEARRLLADPMRTDKLVTIALDSGFASVASFNRAFGAIEGRTPSEYRSAIRDQAANQANGAEAIF